MKNGKKQARGIFMVDKISASDAAETEKSEGPTLVEKFVIRLPAGLRDQIKQVSEQNRRSMNSEILMMIEGHLHSQLQHEMIAANPDDGFAPGKRAEEDLKGVLEAMPADKKEALLKLLV
jgi:hypothetical protein